MCMSSKGSVMEWMSIIGDSIQFIESHITEDLSAERIAKEYGISTFYFQKGFNILCGFTFGEYVRNRRLSLAGRDIVYGNEKVIDVALKYGYDSPDSFTKAFTRFHGVTPVAARKDGVPIKSFAPLRIVFSLEGGYSMDYKIVRKESFTVIGNSKKLSYEGAQNSIPAFWGEHFASGKGRTVRGVFGISIDENLSGDGSFEYLIADPCEAGRKPAEGFVVKTVPEFTWAVFPCVGAMPAAMQTVVSRIYSEWLPSMTEYAIAAGYCIESYNDPSDYKKGVKDENYYSEIWMPVKKK